MEKFQASAPSKLILCGEHAVVYGATAIVAPLANRTSCTASLEAVAQGEGEIRVQDSVGVGRLTHDGRMEDKDGSFAAKAAVLSYLVKCEALPLETSKVLLSLSADRVPKGTGGSASAFAAMSLALMAAFGRPPSKERLFEAVQAGEEIAHGGKASGVDAKAVLSDSPLEFSKEFKEDGQTLYHFSPLPLALPAASTLVVINTLEPGRSAASTAVQVKRFASKYGIRARPEDMLAEARAALVAPFNLLEEKIRKELQASGDAALLGKLFDENHFLLKEAGVSSPGIEKALHLCKENGALGGKLTGAGGEGGACFALVPKENLQKILQFLGAAGFEAVEAAFDDKGPLVSRL